MTTTKIVSSNAAYNDEYMRKKRLNLDFQAREKAYIEAWSNGVPSHLRPKIGYKTVKYGPENSPENRACVTQQRCTRAPPAPGPTGCHATRGAHARPAHIGA